MLSGIVERVLVSIAYWIVTSVVVGFVANRISLSRLDLLARRWLPFGFEAWGEWYETTLRIRRWKRFVPEAGKHFRMGFDKSTLHARESVAVTRLQLESVRAEIVHRWLIVLALVPMVWLPASLLVVPVLYSAVANLPCLAIARYNRLRATQTIVRLRARGR
jgi:glycosyl-4,4'-diaponeurosporenoate acyltransferase